MAVSTPSLPTDALVSSLASAARGGAQLIQLRDKGADAASLRELAMTAKLALPHSARLLINDRVDVALAVEAEGVHLPESGLPVSIARRLLGEGAIIGRSVHSVEAAVSAAEEGVDYLLVGTMFKTSSKPGKTPEGPALLKAIAAKVTCPLLGIGGIDEHNVHQIMAAGASGCAAISSILQGEDSHQRAATLISAMGVS